MSQTGERSAEFKCVAVNSYLCVDLTQNEVLLAAFLAEPDEPATQLAYIARLEERGIPAASTSAS